MTHYSWGDVNSPDQNTQPTPGLISTDLITVGTAPNILTVGAGREFATLAQAVSAATNGSVILVDAGTYTNDFATVTTKITIVGVGGMANFVATEAPTNDKGIITVDNDVNIINCSFSGAAISDDLGGNAAGIRYEGGQMMLENDSFSNNQNGVLGAPVLAGLTNTVTVDHCLFQDNGSGTGYTHNFYMGSVASVTFTNNISEGAVVGHEFKSRAYTNVITNNVFMDGPSGTASYEVDLPNGGADTISGNNFEKGAAANNQAFVHFGGEGIPYAGSSLSVTGNIFHNDYGAAAVAVLNQTPNSAVISGNVFDQISAGNIASGPATETNNFDDQGGALPDQTLTGILPGNTLIITDADAHSVTLENTLQAVEGGTGHLTVYASGGHVIAIGGTGGMDFSESAVSGGNIVTTLAGATDTLALTGSDLIDSEGTDSITCGAANINGTVGGTAHIADGTGNDQWSVTGTASIAGQGGNPVVAIGPTGYASITGPLGYLHVEDNGGSFAYSISQGGATETVSDTGGAVDVQVYNACSFITTGGGATGAAITLGDGAANVLSTGADVIDAGAGAATIIVEGAAVIHAGTGALAIYGRADLAGATVYGNGGNTLIDGDTGNITYIGGDLASTVTARVGNIALIGGGGQLTVLGGSGSTIAGGSGGLVYDAIDGGGADHISTQAGATDTLTLAGADQVLSCGQDVINAGSGNQSIAVYGNSTVNGSTGNSVLTFAGTDTLNEQGYDQISVLAGAHLTVNAGSLTFLQETGATVTIADQDARASATVSDGAATIYAGTAVGPGIVVDTASGTATSVIFGTGADTLVSAGADSIHAGSGSLSVQLQGNLSSVTGGSGALTIVDEDYVAGDSHSVTGGAGDLVYAQATGQLVFTGGAGSATIDGGGGSLSITGGSGNLTVQNGEAGLSLLAGSGTLDVTMPQGAGCIEFGSGTAHIQAGYGAPDVFTFVAGHGGGNDTITGFRAGTDTLSLSGVTVTAETLGTHSTSLVLSDNTQVTLAGFTTPQLLGDVVTAQAGLSIGAGVTMELTEGGALSTAISGAGALQLDSGTYTTSGTLGMASLDVEAGAALSGAGTISAATLDEGVISAGAKTVLTLAGPTSIAGKLAGTGTIQLAGATSFAAGATLAAGSVIDTGNVTLTAAGTLTSAAGHSFALQSSSGSTLTMVATKGESFSNAGSLVASGGGTEAISAAFINAGTVSANTGTLSFLGAVTNNGAISVTGTMSAAKSVSGTGTVSLLAAANVSLLGGAAATETVNFIGRVATLNLGSPSQFLGHIAGFTTSEKIDLLGTAATSLSYAGGTLSVMNGSSAVAALHFTGNFTSSNFVLASDGHGGSMISFHS